MELALEQFLAKLHWGLLAAVIVVSLGVLGRAADRLVDEAVALSERSGISKAVIGATVVSLGTTTPETAVSVIAAIQGSPALALGNAVGSIICDTGLILGLACLIAPLRFSRQIVNRQGYIQLAVAVALILACFPWRKPQAVFTEGGVLPQFIGFVFLGGLAVYVWRSITWSRRDPSGVDLAAHEKDVGASTLVVLGKLIVAVAIVVLSARVLIPAVAEAAIRLAVPESIIAGTLVAFGTSLPELITALTAARKGHGELAVGNVIGADILNVLFVSGAAAAVTPQGLQASPHFFAVMFPVMIFILLVFRAGVLLSGDHLRRPFGFVLLGAYGVYLAISYLVPDVVARH